MATNCVLIDGHCKETRKQTADVRQQTPQFLGRH
jgi:hypothetical protein